HWGRVIITVTIGSQLLVGGLSGTTPLGIAETHPHYELVRIGTPVGCAIVAMLSSALAGISGILVTDFVMFILKLIAAIAVCVFAIRQPAVGGLSAMVHHFAAARPEHLNFLPAPSARSV